MKGKPPAVVIGLDSVTGLQASRLLSREGVPVVGLAGDPGHPCARTRVCRQVISAPIREEAALLEILTQVGRRLGEAVLIPCTDLSVLALARHQSWLRRWFRFNLPSAERIESLLDKASFADLVSSLNLPMPRTVVIRQGSALEPACRQLRFPCVVKPSVKTRRWEEKVGEKAFLLETAAQLRDCYRSFGRHAPALVVQEWVEGGDDRLYTCNAYFGRQGRLLMSFVSRKLRQWPPRTGTACLSVAVHEPEVVELARRLFADFRGLAYLEAKRDPRSGRLLLIEANVGRPTGRSYMAEAMGLPMTSLLYADALGWPLPLPRPRRAACPVKAVHWRRDCQASLLAWRKGELSIRQWRRSLGGLKVPALWDWRDPLPFFLDGFRTLGKLVRRRPVQIPSRPDPGEIPESGWSVIPRRLS